MKKFLNVLLCKLGYIPAPAPVSRTRLTLPSTRVAKKPNTTFEVNDAVRYTLTMAKKFYAERGNTIMSIDLQNYLDCFEDALLLAATDGASTETAKLFGQIPSAKN